MLVAGKKYQVFSIKERAEKSGQEKSAVWVKAGMAFVNRDGSLNVYLDVLPLDGRLHVREALEKRDEAAGSTSGANGSPADDSKSMGVH